MIDVRHISEKSKLKEHRGFGDGADYKPYIQAREFSSLGTCATPIDWKTGRVVQLLSQGELALWYLLRWQDDIKEVKEQYPLPLGETLLLADLCGIRHPHNRGTRMTTDFLVIYWNGSHAAFSLKDSIEALQDCRTVEKLYIEKLYWEHTGVPFQMIYKTELNMLLVQNIRLVVEYYRECNVHDDYSVLKHLIATKVIRPDMTHEILDFSSLLRQYVHEVSLWKEQRR